MGEENVSANGDAIVWMTLYGGPHDGEKIDIHRDNLKIYPLINVQDQNTGKWSTYGLSNEDKFVWLPNPDDPKVQRGWFVCDDDGNLISKAKTEEDALEKLNEPNDNNGGNKRS